MSAFIYEGNEFNHSKKNEPNSYNLPLSINALTWQDKKNNPEFFAYTRELILLRKSIDALKYTSKKDIEKKLKFIEELDASLVGYILDKEYLVFINVNHSEMTISDNVLEKYIGSNNFNKIEKIFDKEGKNNISVDISHGISIEPLSINVYKIGDKHGL